MTLNGTLTIHNIKDYDAGNIRCTAHNHLGLEQATFSLVILQPPAFKRELGTHRVKFGDLFELKCALEDTFPKPKITWILNNRDLDQGRNSNGRILVEYDRKGYKL